MPNLNIETKQDSPEKLAAVQDIPTYYYIKAIEFNKIVQAINQLYSMPTNNLANAVVSVGTITASGTNRSFNHWAWRNNNNNYLQQSTQNFNFPYAESGIRVDMIVGNQFGDLVRVAGTVDGAIPLPTASQTLITYIIITTDSIVVEQPTSDGFLTKSSFGTNPVVGADNVVLKRNSRVIFKITNAKSIIGFETIIASNPTDEIYPGQLLYLYNDQPTACILKHSSSDAPVAFKLPYSTDYTIPPYSGVSLFRPNDLGPYCLMENQGKYRAHLFTTGWTKVTGVTSISDIGTINFPAHFFPARAFIRMTCEAKSWNNTNSSKNVRAFVDSNTSKILFNSVSFGANEDSTEVTKFIRNLRIDSGKMYAPANSSMFFDFNAGQPSQAGQPEKPNGFGFDVSTAHNFWIRGAVGNATDEVSLLSMLIEIIDLTN